MRRRRVQCIDPSSSKSPIGDRIQAKRDYGSHQTSPIHKVLPLNLAISKDLRGYEAAPRALFSRIRFATLYLSSVVEIHLVDAPGRVVGKLSEA